MYPRRPWNESETVAIIKLIVLSDKEEEDAAL
jgi:hypothetical protein